MKFFASSGTPSKEASCRESEEKVTLLVIQADHQHDSWSTIFAGRRLGDGRGIEVVQAGWDDLLLTADSPAMSPHTPVLVHVRKRGTSRTVRPDFLLVRNEVREATRDFRNVLFGFMFAGIPSVNSLGSIYSFLERPIVQGELHRVQSRLGVDKFPVIPQSYFSSHQIMMYGREFPVVLKVGHAHAGAGKMRVADHHDWEDVRSVVCMTEGKYCTAEPFVAGAFDVRIQKIGHDHYRSYRRMTVAGNWKTQTGCAIIEEIELTAQYKQWADEASRIFGGLDICTVDVIHDEKTGKEYILEVNGTSSSLLPEHVDEDNGFIRDLVLEKMNGALLC